ncbi:hypothetical protein HDU96_002934, partial [Phlyctochytrium bullatum]
RFKLHKSKTACVGDEKVESATPEPAALKKPKWWSKLKYTSVGDNEAGPAWPEVEVSEIPCREWGWDVDRYFAEWEENYEEIPGLKVPWDEISEDDNEEYDEEEEVAPVVTVIPADQRWIPLWARKVDYDHVSIYEDDDDDDDDDPPMTNRKAQHEASPIMADPAAVSKTEKAVVAPAAETVESERSVRTIQSILQEILASALERLDIDTLTDKLQFRLTQPEAVPRLRSPNTALTLVEELDAILPHDLGSRASNDPAPAAAIPSVEVLSVNKEASITDVLSETSSGASARSDLKVAQVADTRCIKIKKVSIATKSFNANAYVAKIRTEARQAALLAKPSTPSIIKAVFENDPDTIVPHDWVYGSSTYASTSAFLEAVLKKEAVEPATINQRPTLNIHSDIDDVDTSVPELPSPNTALTLVDELDTVFPSQDSVSGHSNDITLSATSSSSVETLPTANKDASVLEDRSETRTGGSGRSTLEFLNDTCERNKMVSLATSPESNLSLPSESNFDPQAYLEQINRESRHAALLAQPSTPSTIKAVFDNDPDAIVPRSWIHGSRTFPAPASSTAFYDAVSSKVSDNGSGLGGSSNGACNNKKTVSWASKSGHGQSSTNPPFSPTSNNNPYLECEPQPAALLAGPSAAPESHTATKHLPPDNATTNNSDATSRRREGVGERYRRWEQRMGERILRGASWCMRTLCGAL